MNEFKRFEDRLTGLIESLSPSGRRRLSAELAKRLRQSQQRRVRWAQKAPDGTPYAPRQQQSAVRKKTGRVKRKMFAKLRITSRLKAIRADSPEQASMEFYGGKVHRKSPACISSVCRKKPSPERRRKKIDYPARPLLGFTGEDVQMIEEHYSGRTSTD
ncbi:phage virion morphogenesis protein [Escherichia coli]|nr:phage virion morphogenesis protein [Escherichia coli]